MNFPGVWPWITVPPLVSWLRLWHTKWATISAWSTITIRFVSARTTNVLWRPRPGTLPEKNTSLTVKCGFAFTKIDLLQSQCRESDPLELLQPGKPGSCVRARHGLLSTQQARQVRNGKDFRRGMRGFETDFFLWRPIVCSRDQNAATCLWSRARNVTVGCQTDATTPAAILTRAGCTSMQLAPRENAAI